MEVYNIITAACNITYLAAMFHIIAMHGYMKIAVSYMPNKVFKKFLPGQFLPGENTQTDR